MDTLKRESSEADETVLSRSADMRYFGQGHELEIHIPNGNLSENDFIQAEEDYHQMHKVRFGYAIPSYEVEIVNLRLAILGKLKKPEVKERTVVRQSILEDAKRPHQQVYIDGAWNKISVYDRSHLVPGNTLEGPCIIGQMDSTTLLKQNDTADIDGYGNIVISIGEPESGQL